MSGCSDALLVGAKALADERGVTLDMHRGWDAQNPANIAQLQQLGVLGPNVQLVHMGHVLHEEVELLRASNTSCIHCPAASMRVAIGVSRTGKFPELVSAGVNVGLGSDSGNYVRCCRPSSFLSAVLFPSASCLR